MHKKVKVNSQSQLFKRMSMLFTSTAQYLDNQGELTKIYSGQAMKYYEQEYEPLEELLGFRDQIKAECTKFKASLDQRKELLYNKQEFSQWGFSGSMDELVSRSDKFVYDKELAFKYMLSADT